MLRTAILLSVLLIGQATAWPAAAAEAFLSGRPGNAFVAAVVEATNALVPKGRTLDGTRLAPITPEERRNGVIPFESARRIVNLAADTALAQFCGLDWRNISFRPIMLRERTRGKWSDRQLAYIGLLHGVVQGQSHGVLQAEETCTGEMKSAVATFFAEKRW